MVPRSLRRLALSGHARAEAERGRSGEPLPGPVAQSLDESRGLIFHTRDFPSRFPHIVLQRTDAVGMKDGAAVSTNWSAKRLQNQQNSLQTNRTLDVLALGVDLLKLAL